MNLPSTLKDKNQWVFLGPMGPKLPSSLMNYPLICVDGGAHFSKSMDIWIGDGDSFEKTIETDHIFKFSVDKDLSDLALAFNLFKTPLRYEFHLWGFLGGRRDHELFNLGEAFRFLETNQQGQIRFYDQNGKVTYFMVGAGQWTFSHQGLFSLGTLKETAVTMIGKCRYPITTSQVLLPLTSQGLSNLGDGEIILENEGPVFIYFPEDQ